VKRRQNKLKKPFSRREASILSPLRYPGAKRRLAGYVAEVLRLNSLRPKVFVEPFAGGASVSLQLLNDDVVETVALGEIDPLLTSFWKVVFNEPEWLIKQVESIDVTVDNWKYFRENSFRSNRDRALACLFLNRTSFSGILAPGSGPIGGYSQESQYKINCRFTIETIKKRIRQAARLRDRILFIDCADWPRTLEKVEGMGYGTREVFYYLDPPFYSKARRLYRFFFDENDHKSLHNTLVRIQQPWLLSYDPAEQILNLYSHNGQGPKHVDLIYSASANGGRGEAQELIITNLSHLPRETRLWRSSEEWGRSANGIRSNRAIRTKTKARKEGDRHG
jgi:DNA adenine methylase